MVFKLKMFVLFNFIREVLVKFCVLDEFKCFDRVGEDFDMIVEI